MLCNVTIKYWINKIEKKKVDWHLVQYRDTEYIVNIKWAAHIMPHHSYISILFFKINALLLLLFLTATIIEGGRPPLRVLYEHKNGLFQNNRMGRSPPIMLVEREMIKTMWLTKNKEKVNKFELVWLSRIWTFYFKWMVQIRVKLPRKIFMIPSFLLLQSLKHVLTQRNYNKDNIFACQPTSEKES